MALLDELVLKEDLDPEVIGQSSSAFKNLPELEKIRRLIQMDLLEEPHLLRNMSDRYNLPLLSTTLDEVQNYENPPLSKQLYERTGILPMRLGSKCTCLLSVQSNWLKMNQVAFHLGEPIYWYLAQQQQIEHCFKLLICRLKMLIFLQPTEFIICLKKLFPAEDQIFILNLKKIR